MRDRELPHVQMTIRSLFGYIAGLAFVAFVIHWCLYTGVKPADIALFVIPWAMGSLAGIGCMRRLRKSSLVGSVFGGTLALFAVGGICAAIRGHPMSVFVSLAFLGIPGSAILAGIVGVVGEGVSFRRVSH